MMGILTKEVVFRERARHAKGEIAKAFGNVRVDPDMLGRSLYDKPLQDQADVYRLKTEPRDEPEGGFVTRSVSYAQKQAQMGTIYRRLLLVPPRPARPEKEQWSDEKNARRWELINKEVDGVLTDQERAELQNLQEEMLRYLRTVAPLPLEEARQFYEQLLKQQQQEKHG